MLRSKSAALPALTLLVAAVLPLAWAASAAMAQEAKGPSPDAFLKSAMADCNRHAVNGNAGEDFCWHAAAAPMNNFLEGYQAWKDTAWLDAGVKFYDFCISKMQPGPDGFKGWVGSYGDSQKLWCDVHVGDAVLIDNMLAFAEVVLKDEALKKTYGEAANRYVALAKKDLFEKWDTRGTWHEDGPYGAYVQWDVFCDAGDLKSWKKRNDGGDTLLSLPHNKQNHMALCALKLYRITGDKQYRAKAEKIFSFAKSRMMLVDNYYTWNYWEPFGPWDIDLPKKDARLWMNTHGHRDYQATEVRQAVEAYNSGLVFDQKDMERMVNANLEVMWNKDKAAPTWVNSNAELEGPLSAEKRKAAAEVKDPRGRSGALWPALMDFNQTVRDLYALNFKDGKGAGSLAKAYFENVTLKSPPSFKRHYSDLPVTVFEFPFSPCHSVTVASVLPSVVKRGTPTIVFCKLRVTNDLKIALYSADGKKELATLHQGKVEGGADGHGGVFLIQWDPATVKDQTLKGDYRVARTVADGYREYPITIKE